MQFKGSAAGLSIVVGLVVAFILAFLVLQDRRLSRLQARLEETKKFELAVQRMRNILNITDLCTCNLRGLKRPVDGDIVIEGANPKGQFGYYSLSPNSQHDPAVVCQKPLKPDEVVIHTEGTFKNSQRVRQVRIGQFTNMGEFSGQKRYAAKFQFVGDLTLAKSTQSNSTDIDVYVQLQNDTIYGCFAPNQPKIIQSESQCTEIGMAVMCNTEAYDLANQCVVSGGTTVFNTDENLIFSKCIGNDQPPASIGCWCGDPSSPPGDPLRFANINNCNFKIPLEWHSGPTSIIAHPKYLCGTDNSFLTQRCSSLGGTFTWTRVLSGDGACLEGYFTFECKCQ